MFHVKREYISNWNNSNVNNLSWIFGILQVRKKISYITDIDDNITSLKAKITKVNDKETIKLIKKLMKILIHLNLSELVQILI